MSSYKKNQFKVSFRNKNGGGTLGLIGGASQETASQKTIYDLENFLKSKYSAVEYSPSEQDVEHFKVNLILNEYPHVIKRTIMINEESPLEDKIKSYEVDNPYRQAKNIPIKNLGADIVFYSLRDIEKDNKGNEINILIDRSKNYIHVINDTYGRLTYELLLYQEITEKELSLKAYELLLRHKGKK